MRTGNATDSPRPAGSGLLALARRGLSSEAEEWGVTLYVAAGLLAFPVVGGAGLIVLWQRPLVQFLESEDSVLEWATVGAFLAAGTFAVLVCVRLWSHGQRWQAGLYGLLALACLLAVGEEISWGERHVGVTGSERIRAARTE